MLSWHWIFIWLHGGNWGSGWSHQNKYSAQWGTPTLLLKLYTRHCSILDYTLQYHILWYCAVWILYSLSPCQVWLVCHHRSVAHIVPLPMKCWGWSSVDETHQLSLSFACNGFIDGFSHLFLLLHPPWLSIVLGYFKCGVFEKKSLEGTPQSVAYRNLGHSIWREIPIDIVAYIVHIEHDPLVK